jgi:hypothetical protein
VNHIQEYVRGEVHAQGIENCWSLLRRALRGTYVAVEPFHLDRYVTEQVFRFNNRATKDNPLNEADRFAFPMSQVAGKRLTYAELAGKGTDSLHPPEAGRGQEVRSRVYRHIGTGSVARKTPAREAEVRGMLRVHIRGR